jgi:glycosyltransferase involved in cell wall biosynthesis
MVNSWEACSLAKCSRNHTYVSIIVCTRNRYASLRRCLGSVFSSELSYLAFEVIVVDGSSSPAMRKRIAIECSALGAKYVRATPSGIGRARGIGAREAKGRILVFVDDDIVVTRDTIRILVENYANNNVAAAPGRIVSLRNDKLSRLFEKYSTYDRGTERYEVGRRDMSITTLLKSVASRFADKTGKTNPPPYSLSFGLYSFRKSVLDSLGGFDQNLGRGTPQRGGEDLDMYYRILKGGYLIVYEPRSVAYHDHKHSFKQMFEQAYSNGCASASLFKKPFRSDPYMFLTFLGGILLCILTSLNATLQGNLELRKLSQARLAGMWARLIRPLRKTPMP